MGDFVSIACPSNRFWSHVRVIERLIKPAIVDDTPKKQDEKQKDDMENNPIHLYALNFFAICKRIGNYNSKTDPKKFNVINQVERNMIGVPYGGWVAIRFRADNPGFWFLHCHFEVHTSWGVKMAFLVDNENRHNESLLPPPKDLSLRLFTILDRFRRASIFADELASGIDRSIKEGKVIVVPTDTLYGFACDAWYSFRDGLRESVSHLPILTDSTILILVLSSLTKVRLRVMMYGEVWTGFGVKRWVKDMRVWVSVGIWISSNVGCDCGIRLVVCDVMIAAIGIDLGTTYSCVGVWKHDRLEIVPNDQGNRTTPSYVAFVDDERLVGDGAKNKVAICPQNTIFEGRYTETTLLWSLSVFIKSSVIWERVHDFQLGIKSYQRKVNLTAQTISFPGIEEFEMFSIIYEPVHGIIYKNSKKEKRVMRHS
nr:laccase-4-like [Tanacetum cinerariifolium]